MHIIKINWNDAKSIKQAERQKARCENAGLKLINALNPIIK